MIKQLKNEKEFYDEILSLKTYPSFDEDLTIREYLMELLLVFWEKRESFSSKRPLGDSGWEYDLYYPLVLNKIIKGTIEEGDLKEFDSKEADKLIENLIRHIFKENTYIKV